MFQIDAKLFLQDEQNSSLFKENNTLATQTWNITMTSQERHVFPNHRSFECLCNRLCGPTSMKHQSPHYRPSVRGIHRWSVNSPPQRVDDAEKSFHMMTPSWRLTEGRLNMISSRCPITSMGTPIIKIRRPHGRFIFIIEIQLLRKPVFILRRDPRQRGSVVYYIMTINSNKIHLLTQIPLIIIKHQRYICINFEIWWYQKLF